MPAGLRDGLILRMKDADWDLVLAVNLTRRFPPCPCSALKPMSKRRFGRDEQYYVDGRRDGQSRPVELRRLEGRNHRPVEEPRPRGRGPQFTVNCVAPGFIESPMTDVLTEAQKAAILSGVPMGRLGAASEIASAVVYLASSEAAYVTGETLHVNGGMAMN